MSENRACVRIEMTSDDGLPYAVYYDPEDYRPFSPDIYGNCRTPPVIVPICSSPEQMSELGEPDDFQLDTADENDYSAEDDSMMEEDANSTWSNSTCPLPKRIKIIYACGLGEGMSSEDEWRETANATYSLFRTPSSGNTNGDDFGYSPSFEPYVEHIEEGRTDDSVAICDNGNSMDLVEEFNILCRSLERKPNRIEALGRELERYKMEGDEPWPELRYSYSQPLCF